MGRLFISGGHSEGASASVAVCVRLTLPHGGGRHARGGCTETQPPAPGGRGVGPSPGRAGRDPVCVVLSCVCVLLQMDFRGKGQREALRSP